VNEDTISVDGTLALVADGMGGHAAGEVASELAVKVIRSSFWMDSTKDGLRNAVMQANEAIMSDAERNIERRGMGTTIVALALTRVNEGLLPIVINIGDSRAYQIRDGALNQITADHSVAEEWVRQGRLTAEEAAVHPRRHQLTRTLGIEREVSPDLFSLTVSPGDRILLCSDGLSNELTDLEIAEICSAPHTLDEAVSTLVVEANRHGGRDNISAVLVEFVDVSAAAPVVVVVPAVQPSRAELRSPARDPRRAPRRFTWRTALFCMAIALASGAAYGVLKWYGYSSYYLASYQAAPHSQPQIAVYQGQPGGLLWFHPRLRLITSYWVVHLNPFDRQALAGGIVESTFESALSHADYLHQRWCDAHLTIASCLPQTNQPVSSNGGG
jgi:serine/threonine protein phosphatase PrpC